jgi:hypothetical protein
METTNQRSGNLNLNDLAAQFLKPIQAKEDKKKRNQWKPDYSRFKLKCYYKDGNASVHYSYDIYHKYENKIKNVIHDECEGLTKLITYILSVQHKIKTAVIWVTFDKEAGTDKAQYNYEVYKMLSKSFNDPLIKKSDKIYFIEGKLNTQILKLAAMQETEGRKNV